MGVAREHRPRVIVTDAGRDSAVSIIRSLGRLGWHVVAADSDAHSPGFFSRYAHGRLRYPDPAVAPDKAARRLLAAAMKNRIDLIIPVTDEIIVPLSRLRERFSNVCVIAMPDQALLGLAMDKEATLQLARRLNIPTPRTIVVRTAEEGRQAARLLGWPIVVKPAFSRSYQLRKRIDFLRVSYARDEADLDAGLQLVQGHGPVLLQEYYRGEGHGVELLLYEGEPLAAFQHRRLREVPVTGGPSSFRESVHLDPEVYGYALRLLGSMRWTGLAMVEFKVGSEGPKLMEVNGRVWGSLPLSVRCGIDFPALMARLLLNGPPAGQPPGLPSYAVGIRSRDLELELAWILSVLLGRGRYPFLDYPSRSQAFRAALDLALALDELDILAEDDPRPAAAKLLRVGRRVARMVAGRLI